MSKTGLNCLRFREDPSGWDTMARKFDKKDGEIGG